MCAGFSANEEDLYFKTVESVSRRLRATRDAADLLAVVREAYQGFDRAYATAPAAARKAVACHAGCGTCCYEQVGVQAHEVLIAAEFVQEHYSPAELESVIARAAFARRPSAGPLAPRTPCVLLRDGSCSIYAARPEACRAHHSHNAAACRQNLAAGNEAIDVYIRGLRGRMFAVMLGIDQAAVEAGFDGQAYDFGSALHEALTDRLCAVRWTRRQSAFPVSCRETPDENDPEAGEMRRWGAGA